MAQAKTGDTVSVHYTGTLEDGTVFDTSRERDPLEFTLGEGRVLPGFESAVLGLEPGDSASTTIPPEKGYGERREDLVLTVPREQLPDTIEPKPGQQLEMRTPDGRALPVTVVQADDRVVLLDANHPLAGRELRFELELVGIAD